MKLLFFVLLAVCAINAQSSGVNVPTSEIVEQQPRGVIINGAMKIVETISHEAKKAILVILGAVGKIVNGVKSSVERIAKSSNENVAKIVENIERKINKLAENSEDAKQCVAVYRPHIKATAKNATDKIFLCVKGAFEQTKRILDDVHEYVEAIRDNLDAMQDMVAECFETNGKVVGVATCIGKQVMKFKKNIFGLIGNANKLVIHASKRAAEIVADGTTCIAKALLDVEKETTAAVKKVHSCILKLVV